MEHAFLPVTSSAKHLEPVTPLKVEPVWERFLQVIFCYWRIWATVDMRGLNILLKMPSFPWCSLPALSTPPFVGRGRAWEVISLTTYPENSCRDHCSIASLNYLHSLSGQPVGNFFSPLKASEWVKNLGKYDPSQPNSSPRWPWTDSWRQFYLSTSGNHLFEFAVFTWTSPDVLCLGEADRTSCETVGNI